MKPTHIHPLGFLAALLLACTTAHAGVNLIVRQVGSDVIITGGGDLITNGWNLVLEGPFIPYLSDEQLTTGSPAQGRFYDTPVNFSGPEFISGGPGIEADSGTGPTFAILAEGGLVVPANYSSGVTLTFSSATFNNTTITDLAFTADKLHWSWEDGNGNPDFFNIVVARPSPKNITYQITADPGLANGYGYSGTVTTDGTLGNFASGQPLPIIDWSITLTTPDATDGVSERILTPLNSYLSSGPGAWPIQFTATQIILPDGVTTGSGMGFINHTDGAFESFFAYSAVEGAGGGISINDASEFPFGASWNEPTPADFVFATAITHPQLRIDSVAPAGASLSWDSAPGGTYGIYSSSNLIDWVAVPGFSRINATPPSNTALIPIIPAVGKGFYFLGPATGD